MPDNLRRKTFWALAWSFFEVAGQRGMQFVVGLILARLLFPEEFGRIAMLMIFITFCQAFGRNECRVAVIEK